MKSKITDEIKDLFSQSLSWAKLEVEYVKLTAAEKLVIMMSMLILGAVIMVLMLPICIMLLFALADVFKLFMPPALAYLSVGGIVMILLAIVLIFRNAIVINPVSKFITRLLFERKSKTGQQD